jgi:hypothetical protein
MSRVARGLVQRAVGSHGCDDVMNRLTGGGGISFAENKRGVRGIGHDAVSTVARQ